MIKLEHKTAYVRAYSEKTQKKPVSQHKKRNNVDTPSDWSLVFDCETNIDAAQALRVGFYQVRKSGELKSEGLFYDPDNVSNSDLKTIQSYAANHKLNIGTVHEFRHKVFLRVGYEARASIIGFNLPFDISRIALDCGPARGSLRGGFTFKLSEDRTNPQVRVKHLSSTAALYDFAKPKGQDTPRGMRKKGLKVEPHRGYFIDIRTIAMALTSRKHSLKGLAQFLKVETQKQETEEHGGPITEAYLDYARADVQATWECYVKLKAQYDSHGLETPQHRILSEASIGKAYLKQKQVKPLLECQTDLHREDIGPIMSAYFGGRAEARIRREITQVHYADFKSMYPTVNALMGLSRFLIADGYTQSDTTQNTQEFLNTATLEDLQSKSTWKQLTTLVWLKSDDDLLPFRSKYGDEKGTLTIGLNHISSDTTLCYSLADVLASKILTGKTPQIEKAITFKAGPKQDDILPINLFGKPEYRVDPLNEDVFVKFVNLRDEAKARKDPLQQAIKIIANATCYGIFVEVLRDEAPKPETLNIYGPDGNGFETSSTALEEPGKYFNPVLAVLITSAARLMLALAERLTTDQGLAYTFCDTDSIAMTKPDDMSDKDFYQRAQSVIDWFEPLNPYQKQGSILQSEDANYHAETGKLEPLYCLAISAKRYALFNLDEDEKPIIRKASAHGLGHLMEPYNASNPAPCIPKPVIPVHEIGVKHWQHDFWYVIITSFLKGEPNKIPRDFHPALAKPALSRYGATSPAMLSWMKHFNEGKTYAQSVKPFNFLTAPLLRTEWYTPAQFEGNIPGANPIRGRPNEASKPKPIAPFERDCDIAISRMFDRKTGETVSKEVLKTYAAALASYHFSPEDKFDNGGSYDHGPTRRKHIKVDGLQLIGKEANKVGEAGQPDPVATVVVEYSDSNGMT
ncbi:DNA polymerase [Hirschia litorea]|uniref:DNA-directed DNA polymerase n=1 Tax=Hirschia litorea TaxID=1199156 RepID=A0ABW2IJV3_9PROT